MENNTNPGRRKKSHINEKPLNRLSIFFHPKTVPHNFEIIEPEETVEPKYYYFKGLEAKVTCKNQFLSFESEKPCPKNIVIRECLETQL